MPATVAGATPRLRHRAAAPPAHTAGPDVVARLLDHGAGVVEEAMSDLAVASMPAGEIEDPGAGAAGADVDPEHVSGLRCRAHVRRPLTDRR